MIFWSAESMGSGKTLYAVIQALFFRKNSEGTIYANFHIDIDNFVYTPIGVLPFDTIMNSKQSFIILDDCYSLKNLLDSFTLIIGSLSRKTGISIYFTTQYYTSIKKSIRTLANYQIIPHYDNKNDLLKILAIERNYDSIKLIEQQKVIEFDILNVSRYFKYYDTNEIPSICNEMKIKSEILRFSKSKDDIANNLDLFISNTRKWNKLYKELLIEGGFE